MTKFNDFLNAEPEENLADMQKMDGDYGCQLCDKQTPTAYFDEKKLEIIWYCNEQHRSSIKLG